MHHWVYDERAHVRLCEECHMYIHDWQKAKKQGVPYDGYWQIPALRRLAERHDHFHDEVLTVGVAEERYNLPANRDEIQYVLKYLGLLDNSGPSRLSDRRIKY